MSRIDDYYHGPVWNAFGLIRASYLVLPRRALQSMPEEWQRKLVELIDELHDTLPPDAVDANWSVTLRVDGRFTKDWRADYRHAWPIPLRADAQRAEG